MAYEDDHDFFDSSKPECPYWGDGQHKWENRGAMPDYRYTNNPTVTLTCMCGATKTGFDH